MNLISKKETFDHEILNQLIYYYDCDNLICSIKNIVHQSFYLSDEIKKILDKKINHYFIGDEYLQYYTGPRHIYSPDLLSFTNMLFINLYSQLDYTTKLFFEIKNTSENFDEYKKMVSHKMIYGNRKKLDIPSVGDTVFDTNSVTIKTIMSFRNEIIHNGTLDNRQRLYQKYEKGKIVEQYILLPDTTDGNLDKYHGRSHFYGKKNRWNDIVPALLDDYYKRLSTTLNLLQNL